ncbi:VWA domain-containing protein [Silvibacterium sp.]|uniref:VWA domain-containing protein n=1 Tax=Silvibacterium sp. TaxID=1964179 RepID=UPI0039E33178
MAGCLSLPATGFAQEPFPGEPAQPPTSLPPPPPVQPSAPPVNAAAKPMLSDKDYQDPVIRVTSTVVLVPTLVEKKHSGEVIYGLQAKDFAVFDNGVRQQVHLEEDMDTQPVSLVICVERGRDSSLEFDKVARLGPLLDYFLGSPQSQAALVTFDSRPSLMSDFSEDSTRVRRQLVSMGPGDGSAAILDAVGYSLNLLARQPDTRRRVLLLISETRDHGSRHITIPEVVQRVGETNTLVLSLAFSPAASHLREWGKGNGGGSLLEPFLMAANAMKKNAPKTLAQLSGGEYAFFNKDKAFEKAVHDEASHAGNRYVLSFHPTDGTPGMHVLEVQLTADYGARVVARDSYWSLTNNPAVGSATSPPGQ